MPAAANLGEIPIIDEMVRTLIDGLTKKSNNSMDIAKGKQLRTKEERLKAYEKLMKEAC